VNAGSLKSANHSGLLREHKQGWLMEMKPECGPFVWIVFQWAPGSHSASLTQT